MRRFRNILVGVDLSTFDSKTHLELARPSRRALRRAIWLARQTQAELTIFSSLEIYPALRETLQHEVEFRRDAEGILERFAASARSEGISARPKLAFGSPWQAICREVQTEKHDLVVVGTRDVGRMSRFLFGSTGTKLLRNCPCPVWITRPDVEVDHVNILVPSDFSDVSLEAVRIAVEGGQLVDTQIHVLHALEEAVGPPAWYGLLPQERVEEYIAEQRARAKKRLHEQLAQTAYRTLQHGVQVHVVDGPAEDAILKAIDEFQIGLVVMGTAARSGIAGAVLGNTTERLVSQMRCSLLAVKPAGFVCPVSVESESDTKMPAILTGPSPLQ